MIYRIIRSMVAGIRFLLSLPFQLLFTIIYVISCIVFFLAVFINTGRLVDSTYRIAQYIGKGIIIFKSVPWKQ